MDIVQPYDEELGCPSLKNELVKLDKFINYAEAKKGMTGGNVGRALVFPIVIWATYENANQAIDAANQREVYLRGIMVRKKC